jgi:uncharacterized protein HemY
VSRKRFDEIESCFLRAAAANGNGVDAQLQHCLGVLYNVSGNFDRAADSFRTALQAQPDVSV